MATATGKVKWFDAEKGIGFITPDDGGADLFFYFSSFNGDDFKTLKENPAVEFVVKQGREWLQADEVLPV